ncbi:hypothetical protein DV735_g5963, partial [Chaetothyriales sp. CBS 134920]
MSLSLPSWLQWYRKPSYRDPATFSKAVNSDIENGTRPSSMASQPDGAIPANLCLDNVLGNKTCSPLSLYDFYMYLKHIEMSPENLEFFIWYKHYEARYTTRGSESDISQDIPLLVAPNGEKARSYAYSGVPDLEKVEEVGNDSDFQQYIESLIIAQEPKRCWTFGPFCSQPGGDKSLTQAYSNREELQHAVEFFLMPDSPKELNIPPSTRKQALAGLAVSDSPESLAPVVNHVYYLLRNCSHRNFIRLGVKNGTFETLCMVTIVGILFTALGLLTMFLIAFASPSIHHSSRWRGLAAAPFWIVGFTFLFAGWRGSCFLLLLFSRRQEMPWERVRDDSSTKSDASRHRWSLRRFAKKLMIFERKIRVQDQALRNLQRKIVIQSVSASILITVILEVVFLVLPIWK